MFSKTKHDSTKCVGAECNISKIEPQNDGKTVPGGGQTSPFRGVWRVLGGFPLLGRFLRRPPPSPESLLAAFWGCWGTFWPPSWPLKTHLEAREKMIKNRWSSRNPWEPFRWAFSTVQGAKMEASWLQNSIPLGPCLKNGVNLRNTTIPILKIRFWRVQEHAFSINFGYFFDLC